MFEAVLNKPIPSFEDWVRDELNPYRVANDMIPLDDEDIKKCLDIIDDFSKLWRNKDGIDSTD